MTEQINTTLNDVYKSTTLGDLDRAIGSTYFGLNHQRTPSKVPINTDDHGYVFFTRPQLNMQTENLRAERKFFQLLTTKPESIHRIIRNTLDPRLAYMNIGIDCPFVDPLNAFIPMLTEQCLTLPGWPDPVHDTYTSKPGAYKEEFSFVDSSMDIYRTYDISATFRNMQGSPIPLLFDYWRSYQSFVFQGTMIPYPDFIARNIIDYQSRVYRLVMDRTRTIVQRISATGVCYPLAGNIGGTFDYDSTKPLNESQAQVEVQFRCTGALYDDVILMHEFNKVVQIFNPNMRDEFRSSNMVALQAAEKPIFNKEGYPLINVLSGELSWYVTKARYAAEMTSYNRHAAAIGQKTT